jgi:uncharacterized OB-fold protein
MALVRPEPRRNVYEQPFWDFVEQHRLSLQRCSGCGAFRYPPGPVCFRCLSDEYAWTPLEGTGRLLSWVVFHRQYFPELPPPYVVAAARVTEGPILIANLVGGDRRRLRVDAPVRIVYEDAATPEGKIWQIYQWELIEEGG